MCLGVPCRIIKIDSDVATVDVGGTRKDASLMLLEGAQVGDYVIVHAGFAIEKIDEERAMETLALINSVGAGPHK